MDVAAIQRALTLAGFPCVPDGHLGPKTKAAIKAFQRSRGLVVDGVVGPATTAALQAVVSANDNTPTPGSVFIPGLLAADVKRICPTANAIWATALIQAWPDICRIAELTNRSRARDFLAQTAEESGGFRLFQENLNYTAARIREVWPKRKDLIVQAAQLAHNPEALANAAYGGRNGNALPGDGWLYHGRGPIQLTGRSNYTVIGRMIVVDIAMNPNALVTDPRVGWKATAAFWQLANVNRYADSGDFDAQTRAINGGLTNIAERRAYRVKADGLAFAPMAVAVAA